VAIGLDYSAFSAHKLVAAGGLEEVLRAGKPLFDRGRSLLFFRDDTGEQVDFDFRGTIEDVLARVTPPEHAGPGRPKLGVVSREVSLLPRHWEWLSAHPQGASAALRRLVDEARKHEPARDRMRRAQAAVGRFLTGVAGDLPGYEEASRALYAGNSRGFLEHTRPWPEDIKKHARALAKALGCFAADE